MLQEELKNIEKEIKSMIKILIKEISDLEDSAAPIAPENAIGRISRMDAINNKSVVEASLRNRKKKLSKLQLALSKVCLLYTSPSPRDQRGSRMPSSA